MVCSSHWALYRHNPVEALISGCPDPLRAQDTSAYGGASQERVGWVYTQGTLAPAGLAARASSEALRGRGRQRPDWVAKSEC